MPYHYGGSSSSSSSSSTTSAMRAPAPPGYHYMPNGTLMLNSDMNSVGLLEGESEGLLITAFNMDLSSLLGAGESRNFTIAGDNNASFELEIRNEDAAYYNFFTNAFQTSRSVLSEKIPSSGEFKGAVSFPVVTDDDQYDISLYAVPSSVPEESTIHNTYNEVRFGDGSLDINSSTGSNSLMMTKVIYQYLDLALTLTGYSIDGTTPGTSGDDTVSVGSGKSKVTTAFSFTYTAAATAAYRILKQPIADDVVVFVSPVVGSAPIDLPGENIYPTATAAFTGDDVNGAVTSGSVVRMDNTDLSAVIKIGDKITSPLTSTGVDGAVSSSNRIVLDVNADTVTAVGDSISINGIQTHGGDLVTVTHLNPDTDNAKEIQISVTTGINDNATIGFSSKVNREITTVTVVETSGTATDFTMSQAIQFRDNQPLTFTPRMNYSWPINKYVDILREDMILLAIPNITTDTSIGVYEDTITLFEGTKEEKVIVKNRKKALDTLAKKPTVVKGLVTVQEGQIVFNKQQVLALAGDTLKVGGYGESEILRVYGWEVKFTDLAIALTAPTTTTTEATSAHATIAVADREGIINTVSTVSGIGINPSVADPTLTTGGGLDGAGDWIMSATQTLESGVTLTVGNTGRIATITGNIEIVKAGTASQTLRFDVNKLLSTSAP